MTPSTGRNLPGHLVGDRYTLLSMIAKGGMGEVWKARDQRTGKIVAAKVLRPELSGESLPLNRLRLEAQNALLIEHPNIAAVYDSGEDDGQGWLVMELVEGRPLTDYLRNGNRLAPAELIPLLIQMSMALGAAGEAGVAHRDIKPANVLVRPTGIVKITDFGISRTANQVDLTQAGMVMGTAQYLPPEQALGEVATSVGDLYSVGVIAYEACAGKRPFTGKSQVDIAFAHVHQQVPPLPDDVPVELANVIYHLLEKDPKDRPQSGKDLARALITVAQALGVPTAATPLTLPLTAGEATPAPTRAQQIVAPVHHEPVRTLPDEMLTRPNLDEARLDVLVPPRELPQRRFHPVTDAQPAPAPGASQPAAPSPQPGPSTQPGPAAQAARATQPGPAPQAARATQPGSAARQEGQPGAGTQPPAASQPPPPPPTTVAPTRPKGGVARPKGGVARPSTTPARRSPTAHRPAAASHTTRAGGRPSAKVRWQQVTPEAVRPPQRPQRAARTAYSRSVVAPRAVARSRRLGWAFGIAFALIVLVVMVGLMYLMFRSYLPLAFTDGGSAIVKSHPSSLFWGSLAYQEAYHV